MDRKLVEAWATLGFVLTAAVGRDKARAAARQATAFRRALIGLYRQHRLAEHAQQIATEIERPASVAVGMFSKCGS